MIDNNNSSCLFSKKEMYLMACKENGRLREWELIPPKARKKAICENMHLMKGMHFTVTNGFPIMEAYTSTTDFMAIPFTERNKHDGKGQALHFFLDDYRFRNAVWCNLEYTTYTISNYDIVFTPDLSLWRDLPTDFYNKEDVFRTRFIGAYWQQCGFNVIPTASWGGLNSFAYCFEGLPSHSIIAVSGMGNKKNANSFDRWCYALHRLEEEKSPIMIIVYGEDVEVQGLHTPLKFIPCFIQTRLRKL